VPNQELRLELRLELCRELRLELPLKLRLELRPILSQVKAKAERRKAKTLKRFRRGKSLIPMISLQDSFGPASKLV
jgi:hypothetical protein